VTLLTELKEDSSGKKKNERNKKDGHFLTAFFYPAVKINAYFYASS
jgi:hypothetical protein